MDYIHLNAVRARFIQANDGQSVLDYPWSSIAGGYALPPTKRAPCVQRRIEARRSGWPRSCE
jgi:putative transposase